MARMRWYATFGWWIGLLSGALGSTETADRHGHDQSSEDLQRIVSSQNPYIEMIAEANYVGASKHLARDFRLGNHNFLSYSLSLILDPCRGHDPSCCWDIYGSPEYLRMSVPSPMGWLWAIGQDRVPYRCQKPCFGLWERVEESSKLYPLRFDVIDADETSVWAYDFETLALFGRSLDGGTPWKYFAGNFLQLSASGHHALYAIDGDSGKILACYKPCTGEWNIPRQSERHPEAGSDWEGPEGETYKFIDADSTHAYVVTESKKLFMRRVFLEDNLPTKIWADVIDGEWMDITSHTSLGRLNVTQVTSSVVGDTIWILTDDGLVYTCKKPCLEKNWWWTPHPLREKFRQIDAEEDFVYGVTISAGYVYRKQVNWHHKANPWISLPSTDSQSGKSLQAWDAMPVGGFRYITASSNARRKTSILESYTVQEDGRHCNQYSSAESCKNREDESCVWNADLEKCELRIPSSNSRLMDSHVIFDDPNCIVMDVVGENGKATRRQGYSLSREKEGDEMVVKYDPQCVDRGVRVALPPERPRCWDHNDTIFADQPCTDHMGNTFEHCVVVGFSSTAHIPQCAPPRECGTYVEVRKRELSYPISTTRIPLDSSFVNGYRTFVVPLTFESGDAGDESRIAVPRQVRTLCYGEYELWWVQRLPGRNIVEYIKRFHVAKPICDWNSHKNAYEPYATLQV